MLYDPYDAIGMSMSYSAFPIASQYLHLVSFQLLPFLEMTAPESPHLLDNLDRQVQYGVSSFINISIFHTYHLL
jgi:hypothetical protein